LTNGQPTGTQNGSTIASTDSAATENNTAAEAMIADAIAAATWVREHLGEMPRSVRVSRVPIDTVELFATAGIDFNRVLRDSISAVNGIAVGEVYELIDHDLLSYSRSVAERMTRVKQLPADATVGASFAYRKSYLKQRQLVKVVDSLQTNSKGDQYYVVHTGTLDPERPLDEPVWRTQEMVAKQAVEMRLYLLETPKGTALWRWHNGNKQPVGLGSSKVFADKIMDCLESEQYKQLQLLGASSPELKEDDICRFHEGQLVFWKATHLAVHATQALKPAPSAS